MAAPNFTEAVTKPSLTSILHAAFSIFVTSVRPTRQNENCKPAGYATLRDESLSARVRYPALARRRASEPGVAAKRICLTT